jgi:hypothetical protein
MEIRNGVLAALCLLCTVAPSHAGAATLPFTEGFSANASGWLDNASGALTHSASGGQDGAGFVSTQFNFLGSTAGSQGPVLFRGNASASGGAFTGNWLTDGVATLSAWVRHDADIPINSFARFAAPAGFPGAIAAVFTPVAPGSNWTRISVQINPSNPQFVSFEGSDFNAIFASIGRVQIGASIPAALAGVDRVVHFDLDSVSIAGAVPEPSALAVLGLVIGGLAARRAFRTRSEARA